MTTVSESEGVNCGGACGRSIVYLFSFFSGLLLSIMVTVVISKMIRKGASTLVYGRLLENATVIERALIKMLVLLGDN
jgi:hypothetical protein